MSTRSAIGVMHGDKCKAIYCHSDGYLSYNGKVLLANYDSSKANQLVAMGDMSVLGKTIGEKIDFNDRMVYEGDNIATQCRFYGRDRGETGIETQTRSTGARNRRRHGCRNARHGFRVTRQCVHRGNRSESGHVGSSGCARCQPSGRLAAG